MKEVNVSFLSSHISYQLPLHVAQHEERGEEGERKRDEITYSISSAETPSVPLSEELLVLGLIKPIAKV